MHECVEHTQADNKHTDVCVHLLIETMSTHGDMYVEVFEEII